MTGEPVRRRWALVAGLALVVLILVGIVYYWSEREQEADHEQELLDGQAPDNSTPLPSISSGLPTDPVPQDRPTVTAQPTPQV